MGEWDRPEWIPSEEELIAELCNAREIDWPTQASRHFDYRNEWLITAVCDYNEYMQGLLRDGRNFPEIPIRYMDSPATWRGTNSKKVPLNYILNQIQRSPDEYRGYIMGMVDRYLTACEARLDGKWPADLWRKGPDGKEPSDSSPSVPSFTRACYRFCCPEWVGDDDLLKKIIVLQKLQAMISNRARQDDPTTQVAEPAADKPRGRKGRFPSEVFERDIFPVLDKEFPIGGDNTGIKKRCAEIGKEYGFSESTIKSKFYDMQSKNRGNKSG